MNPIWLLALVPPIAFACGWWIARRTDAKRSGARVNELSSDYFRGLNYLLNEEQDKALEVFLRLAEYNRDTVETHLALGNLSASAARWIARSGCTSTWYRARAFPMK